MMKFIIFLKRVIAFIFNKCIVFLKTIHFSKATNNRLINIISYSLLIILFDFFIWDLKTFDIIQIFIFTLISFAISTFISDKFKLSNNKFIKILQNFVIFNIFIALIGFLFYLFDVSIFSTIFCDGDSETEDVKDNQNNQNNQNKDKEKDLLKITSNINDNKEEYYNINISKQIVDKAIETGKDLVTTNVPNVAANAFIGGAVGKVASETMKMTAGMPVIPRMALVGSAAAVTAFGSKTGLELAKATMDQINKGNSINESKSDVNDKDNDGRNSPSDFDGGSIHSPLHENEIPLIIFVNGLSYLNYLELSLILSLFSLLFRKFLIRKFKILILNSINKYIKKKEGESINDENVNLNKAFNTVDKYSNYLIVFIFICLIWIMLINIFFSSFLAENIDSFVKVYNFIKNNSLLFFIQTDYIVSESKINFCYKKNINRKFIFTLSMKKFTREIKFIKNFKLNLLMFLSSLKSPPIFIGLFSIVILLAFEDAGPIIGSYQLNSDLIEIVIPH